MDESTQKPENRFRLYDMLKEGREHAASMCALYTDAGLYDLAKERAAEWRRLDLEARVELNRVIDENHARVSQLVAQPPAPQGTE